MTVAIPQGNPAAALGHGLRSFICDKYHCEMIVEGAGQRQQDGTMLVRGIAATTNLVNGEIFTPEVLERDMRTLEGKPIVDCHSEWPARIRIKDIIGVVRRVWWDGFRQAVMFEGELWDENAMRILEMGLVVNWSVGYKWRWHLRDDGIAISDEIWFDHLGFLNNPGDEEAVALHTERREQPYELVYEAPDEFDFSSARAMKKSETLMHLGYRQALSGDEWGGRTEAEIIAEHTALIEDMIDVGLAFTITDDLDAATVRHLQQEKIEKAMRLLEQAAELDKPLGQVDGERMVVKRGDQWCVVHGHPQKPGSPTDKPIGTPIKCYSISEYGEEGAKKKAQALHTAIILSQQQQEGRSLKLDADIMSDENANERANGEGPYAAGPGGVCVCRSCGYEEKHKRGVSCDEMTCPKCGERLVRKEVVDDGRTENADARAGTKPKEYPWGRKSPPKGFPQDANQYGDPTNYMYPMHDKPHVRNGLARFAQNYERYTVEERRYVWTRLVNKALSMDVEHTYNPASPLDRLLPDSVKQRLPGYKRENSVAGEEQSSGDIMDETEQKPDEQKPEDAPPAAEEQAPEGQAPEQSEQPQGDAQEPESSQEEEGTSDEEEGGEKPADASDTDEDSDADSEDEEDGDASEEEAEESEPADEERAAKQPLDEVEESLTAALRALEPKEDEPLKEGLRSLLDKVQEAKKAEAPEEDEAMRQLKADLAEKEKRIAKFEAAERERKDKERVETLLKDGLFLPAQRDNLKKLVAKMDDEAFKAFRELQTSKAIASGEKGRMDEEQGSQRSEKQEEEHDPYHQDIT